MQNRLTFLFVLISLCLFSNQAFAESDAIYEKCSDQPREPWCYQEEVERIGDADLCENILEYWPKTNRVHGWCFYRLALKQKDCSLCDRIQKKDIRKLCILEVGKSRE